MRRGELLEGIYRVVTATGSEWCLEMPAGQPSTPGPPSALEGGPTETGGYSCVGAGGEGCKWVGPDVGGCRLEGTSSPGRTPDAPRPPSPPPRVIYVNMEECTEDAVERVTHYVHLMQLCVHWLSLGIPRAQRPSLDEILHRSPLVYSSRAASFVLFSHCIFCTFYRFIKLVQSRYCNQRKIWKFENIKKTV